MRFTQRLLLIAPMVLLSLTGAACGSSDGTSKALAQEQQLQQARSDAARAQRQDDRIKQLEQQARQPGGLNKSQGAQAPAPSSTQSGGTSSSSVNFSSCDANIAAAGGASCAFAENTFYEYYVHQGEGSFSVYSPTTGTTYTVSCGPNGANIVCTNGKGAATRFSQNAVSAYSQTQADRYAATHNVGH